jgi:4-diphosphocytidyl-2-C-methyl-D-erythritol kinase
LESLVAFADIGDELAISPAPDVTLSIDGPFAAGLSTGVDNLVLKAARLMLKDKPDAGCHIHLTKNLPIASGIGGGSADAAATLRGLQTVLGVALQKDSAVSLGADIPVCLDSRPTMMRGIGEELTSVAAFPACDIVLINPNKALSTADVFRGLRPPYSAPLTQPTAPGWPTPRALVDFLQTTRNDLIKPAIQILPEISAVVAALSRSPGCLLARMSGSGATCYGIFETDSAAQTAAQTIAEGHPTWWIKQGKLGTPPT